MFDKGGNKHIIRIMSSKKTFALLALTIFVLMAGFGICTASAQPMNASADCGNHSQRTEPCPFITPYVPAALGDNFNLYMILLAILCLSFYIISANTQNCLSLPVAIKSPRRKHLKSPPLPSPVLESISGGILHSRIYAF